MVIIMKENKLGNILKELRAQRRMSLREFSRYLDISHTYLDKLEKGMDARTHKEIAPTIDTLIKISEGTNIPLKEFLQRCGYIDNTGVLFLGEPKNAGFSPDELDIIESVEELKAQVASARRVLYNGRPLTEAERDALLSSLDDILRVIENPEGKA